MALNVDIANELPYNDYFEYFGPDFKLHISPSNMPNQNTQEYMDKIKTRLFENLRMLPHAPGVQMANIPEDGVKDESGAAIDEADPDKRLPSAIKDKLVEPDNEFESGKSGNRDDSMFDKAKSNGAKGSCEPQGEDEVEDKEEPMEVDEPVAGDKDDKAKE